MTARPRPAPAHPDRGAADRGQALARALSRAMGGGVAADIFSRGRYATDASIYQIMPLGVAFPRDAATTWRRRWRSPREHERAGDRAGRRHLAERPADRRGPRARLQPAPQRAGARSTSRRAHRRRSGPGIVLEQLNARLRPHGLFFPVEPSTASRCTIGGMAGNNSCGARSLALRQDGRTTSRPSRRSSPTATRSASAAAARRRPARELARADCRCAALAERERDEIAAQVPEGAAPGRRLQSRRAAGPARRTSRISWSARKARWRSPTEITLRARAAAGAPGHGRLPVPVLPGGDGDHAGTSSRWGRSRSSSSTTTC